MRRKTIIIASAVLLTLVSAGCDKQSFQESDPEMTFNVELADMTKAAGQFTPTVLTSLAQFEISGYDGTSKIMDRRTVLYSNSVWRFNENPVIWTSGHTMTFWASANVPSYVSVKTSSKGSATFDVYSAIPTSASDQWDPLVGYYSGTGNNGNATITFYHPLTAVIFKTGFHGNPEFITGINSVTLAGVPQTGKATVTASGSGLSYSWTRSGTTTVTGDFNSGKTQSATPFLIIPISTSAITSMVINVNKKSGGTQNLNVSLPAGEWQSGWCYTYTLDYANPMEDTLTATLTDWVPIRNTVLNKDWFNATFDD